MELIKNKSLLQNTLKSLPHNPGVYRFYDTKQNILYIGKAKNLKKRVSSYFTSDTLSGKTKVLVRKISKIEYIIVDTEYEALLLENTLIKEYQPRYNVMLKDDKTYPWICIKNEAFQRIFITRNFIRDGSEYFGPYASVKMINTLFELIRKLYQIRTCRLNLSKANIENKKFKLCLEYHIGNCAAPCVGKISQEEYNKSICYIREILKGNIFSVTNHLKKMMNDYAKGLEFEKAQIVKEKLILLERYKGKSTVVNPNIHNVDVFNIVVSDKSAFVNYLKLINGAIVQAHTIEIVKKLDESKQDLLLIAIADLRKRFNSDSKNIILPFKINISIPNISISIPQKGDKKHLLDLSENNAKYYMLEKNKHTELADPNRHTNRVLERLKTDLRMLVLPKRIECFDNSNIQGDYAVAAMVCFIDAKPDKKEYRHFNIKSVKGPDDYASMEEVVYRRYKRLTDEKKPLPQLIIIDGGKGQVNSALKSLESLNLRGTITVIGIAEKLDKIYFPNDPIPLYLDKKSESLKLIQRIRDEAHRFGLKHHTNKRDKASLNSELTNIKGIGEKTAELLLKSFKSVKLIAQTDISEITKVIGKAKAKLVYEYFKS